MCYKFFHRKHKPTPCSTCPKPFLMEGNFTAWEIFLDYSSQIRAGGMGGVIGFDLNALRFLFEAHDVAVCDWQLMIRKVQTIATEAQTIWNEAIKKDSKSNSKPKK